MAKKTKAPAALERGKKFAFPATSSCPRCGSYDTEAYSTKGKVQYRRCRVPVCRWNYSVRGVKIKQERKEIKKDGGKETTTGKES